MIPCEDCLKLPVCRHKGMPRLIGECEDIFKYLHRIEPNPLGLSSKSERYEWRIAKLKELMKPTQW